MALKLPCQVAHSMTTGTLTKGQTLFKRISFSRSIRERSLRSLSVASSTTLPDVLQATTVRYCGPNGSHRNPQDPLLLPPPWLSVAPMMEYTDAHFRQLARILSHRTWLYTEMVVDNTLLHQQPNIDRWLEFPEVQRPLVLQLGGSDPQSLASATQLAHLYGYDEINLNCGCPSSAVAGHGCFGARLMLDPSKVASIAAAMAAETNVPITIKCRIGVDNEDSYDRLCEFVETVSMQSPVRHFAIHARKALLKGLSPAQNRSVPPLRYEYVVALIRDFPHLKFSINGGIVSLAQAVEALSWGVHGVMIGRAAYKSPWSILGDADRTIYGVSNPAVSRRQVLGQYMEYAEQAKGRYGPHRPSIRALVMPLSSLFNGEPGGAIWRRAIESSIRNCTSVREVVENSMQFVPSHVMDAPPHESLLHVNNEAPLDAPSSLPPPFCSQYKDISSESALVHAH